MFPLSVIAEPTWLVLKTKGASLSDEEQTIFQELLAGEIRVLSKKAAAIATTVCGDERCACEIGKKEGAQTAVFSTVSKLGQKLIVAATSVDTESCQLEQSARFTILKIEELEETSKKIGKVIVEGIPIAEAVEVGTVTEKEQEVAKLREGNNGLSLRVGGVAPFASLQNSFGVLFEAGYWFEGLDFAIEPSLGFEANAAATGSGSYGVFKVGASGVYLFSRGDIAPFLGGGGGVRFISERRERDMSVGQTIQFEGSGEEVEEAWSPGLFLRGGVMFMRTYETRLALNMDYDISFVTLHDDGPVQRINFGLSVIF